MPVGATAQDPEPPPNPLLPAGEEQLMASHGVSADGVQLRPGSGVRVTSDDGLFGLSLGARAQMLWTLSHEEGADLVGEVSVVRAIRIAIDRWRLTG